MGWTNWDKLANKDENFHYGIEYEGPAVYELAVRRRYGKNIWPVYVGETNDLKRRMREYATTGSHLWYYASKYWRMGYTVLYRFQYVDSKRDGVKLQNELLQRYGLERYPWNNNFSSID